MPLAMAAPPGPTPVPTPAPVPAVTGAGGDLGPVHTPPPPPPTPAGPPLATMQGYLYMVGILSATARRAASQAAKAKEAQPAEGAENPAAAAAPKRTPGDRRRRGGVERLGRGHEYLDLDDEPTVWPSTQGAGPLGFSGTATKVSAGAATGLATIAEDDFGGSPRMPMMPSTWGNEVTRRKPTKSEDPRGTQQPQSSPRHDLTPCQIAVAAMPRPITGSNHQQLGQNALTASPTRTAAACAPHR